MVREFLRYVDENRESWRVLYRVAVGSAAFADTVSTSRRHIVDMVSDLIRRGTTVEGALDIDFELTAIALVGAVRLLPTG